MSPLITLVTPSLNQGRFLRRTIDSVLSQNYARLQYLVIDGGSSDETLSILNQYSGRLQWVSESDQGQAHALNKGLRQAFAAAAEGTDHVVGCLNSDDLLLPGALAAVARHFQENPACDVVYGHAYIIDEEDRVLGQHATVEFDPAHLRNHRFLCQPAVFWRRDVMTRFGLFDESLHHALAYEYWLRLACHGVRFERLGRALACSRSQPSSKAGINRLAAYREALAVGRRGYWAPGDGTTPPQLAFDEYYSYWRHRCHEAPGGWPRWLRFLPRPHYWLSLLHYRWDGAGRRVWPFLGHVRRALCRRLFRRAPEECGAVT